MPQRPVNLVPGSVEARHAILVVDRFTRELIQRDLLFQIRQHRAPPDHFPLMPAALLGAFELKIQQARRNIPEPRRIKPKPDICRIHRPEV